MIILHAALLLQTSVVAIIFCSIKEIGKQEIIMYISQIGNNNVY